MRSVVQVSRTLYLFPSGSCIRLVVTAGLCSEHGCQAAAHKSADGAALGLTQAQHRSAVAQGAEAQYFGLPDGEGQDPAAALNAMLHRVGQLAVRVRPRLPGCTATHSLHGAAVPCARAMEHAGRPGVDTSDIEANAKRVGCLRLPRDNAGLLQASVTKPQRCFSHHRCSHWQCCQPGSGHRLDQTRCM
jgi:hypothetical protein